jgi:predicted outer membrane protein
MATLILALLLAPAHAAPGDEAALWSAMYLTAQAAIDAGGLAQSRATSPEIRNLATLVVRDYGEFDRRLRALAASSGIVLADGPKPARVQFEELRSLQGGGFDRKFLNFSYGAADVLHKQMLDAERQSHNDALRDVIALFDRIVQQDQFLSGWCLGHCVQRGRR